MVSETTEGDAEYVSFISLAGLDLLLTDPA